jgi:hypothetical protein
MVMGMSIKTIVKDAFSGIGLFGWIVILAKPVNAGLAMLSDFDLFKNYGGVAGQFLETGWGTLTSVTLGALIVGYAIYRRIHHPLVATVPSDEASLNAAVSRSISRPSTSERLGESHLSILRSDIALGNCLYVSNISFASTWSKVTPKL